MAMEASGRDFYVLRVSDTGTVRVEVVPDLLTYMSVTATLIAAGLALVAIMHADKVTKEARQDAEQAAAQGRIDAAHERRVQWELSILAEMARQHAITGRQHLSGYVRALIRSDAPDDDLSLLRTLLGIYPTDLGRQKKNEIDAEVVERIDKETSRQYEAQRMYVAAVEREIEDAITQRLG